MCVEVPLEEAKTLRVNTVESTEQSTEARRHGPWRFTEENLWISLGENAMNWWISLGKNGDLVSEDGDFR